MSMLLSPLSSFQSVRVTSWTLPGAMLYRGTGWAPANGAYGVFA
jgi:hypothetical protein